MKRDVHIISNLDRCRICGQTPSVWLLSGARDSGKTSRLRDWISRMRDEGLSVSGAISEKVVSRDRVAGYDIVDLNTGSRHPLIRRTSFPESLAVGRYYFDVRGFQELNASLIAGSSGDLLVLDEIGTAEMRLRSGFFPALEYFTGLSVPLILVVRESVVDSLRRFLEKELTGTSHHEV